MSLLTLDKAKEEIPKIQGDKSDSKLQSLIDDVESLCAIFLGFPSDDAGNDPSLAVATYTVYEDEELKPYVMNINSIPKQSITSITSVHADLNREYGDSTEIEADEYDLDKKRGRLILKTSSTSNWVDGFRGNKIVLTAGYTANNKVLMRALAIWVAHLWQSPHHRGMSSVAVEGDSTVYKPDTIPPEVFEKIQHLRSDDQVI